MKSACAYKCRRYTELTEGAEHSPEKPRSGKKSAERNISAGGAQCRARAYSRKSSAAFTHETGGEHYQKGSRHACGIKIHKRNIRKRHQKCAAGNHRAYNRPSAGKKGVLFFLYALRGLRKEIGHSARQHAVAQKRQHSVYRKALRQQNGNTR